MAREAFGGFEAGTISGDGFNGNLGGVGSAAGFGPQDKEGNGGTYYALGLGNASFGPTATYGTHNIRSLSDFWLRAKFKLSAKLNNRNGALIWRNGTTTLGTIMFNASEDKFRFYLGPTLTESSPIQNFPINSWITVEVHCFMHDTLGFLDVFVDAGGDYSTPTWSATVTDTKYSTFTTIDNIGLGANTSCYIDDWALNSLTLRYDNEATGPFQAGETITATGGASAVITSVEDAGSNGVLVLEQWNGTDFIDNETITGGTSGATGLVDAPNANFVNGMEPNSFGCGNGFTVALTPNANGTTSQLTGSDGNSVDNYLQVDDLPANTSDYNASGTNNQLDTYGMTNLPSSAVSVAAVNVYNYSAKDGTGINNASHVLRVNATNYFSSQYALSTSYSDNLATFSVSPDTNTQWTTTEVDAAEAGFRVET